MKSASTLRRNLVLALVLLVVAAAWLVYVWRMEHPPGRDVALSAAPVSSRAATALLAQTLPDVKGIAQPLAQWRGQWLVVNLWATWCTPCRAEMPAFSRLQRKYAGRGVQFIGITLDTQARIDEFLTQTSVGYPLLLGSHTLIPLFAELGNTAGGLPFTILIDRQGRLLRAHQGIWREAELDAVLASLP
jgi:thiol-disulfide isomerase/thioredoxin